MAPKVMPNTDKPVYFYRMVQTGFSSVRYGLCEVCGGPASDVYSQHEAHTFYSHCDSMVLWTFFGCKNLFGHKECLESKRHWPCIVELIGIDNSSTVAPEGWREMLLPGTPSPLRGESKIIITR